MKALLYALGIALLALASGCVTKVVVIRPVPAEVELRRITTLGLQEFHGGDAESFQSALADRLVASRRFAVLDREHLSTLNTEIKKSQETKDYKYPLDVAELLPITAFVVPGKAPAAQYSEKISSKEEKCMELKPNLKVKEYPCVRRIRRGHATCSAEIRVLETTSSNVLVAKDLRKQKDKKTESTTGEPGDIDKDALLAACRIDLAAEFVNHIAPHEVREEVLLEEDNDLPTLAIGNLYAKRGDWTKAQSYYEQAVDTAVARAQELDPEIRGRAYYALGLSQAMQSEYDESLETLEKAIQLYPNEQWIDLQVRVQRWKSDARTQSDREKALSDTEGAPPGS